MCVVVCGCVCVCVCVMQVSRALSQAFDTLEKQAEESVAGKSAQEAIDQAKANIVKVYNPPAEEPQQGEGQLYVNLC